jgi:hypothetical protein
MIFRTILLLCAGAMLNCCSAQLSNKKSDKSHSENLSIYRPKLSADSAAKDASLTTSVKSIPEVTTPTLNVNKKVDAVLDSIDKFNELRKFVDGYTIQIYSGTNREDAMNAKKKMSDAQDFTAVMQYNQPKFRVTTGSYFTRLEAQKDFMRIKRLFPNSILVPEKVPIK